MQLNLFSDNSGLDRVVNVAQVKHRSPFRYPGGKTWLAPRIRAWLGHRKRAARFIEPFGGGGIISLTAAFENLADQVVLIELDPQVAAVWKVILQGSRADIEWLTGKILDFKMERSRVEETLAAAPADLRETAFTTLLRNRV